MSALPPKADMCSAPVHVRLVPKADILQLIRISSIHMLVVRDKIMQFVECTQGEHLKRSRATEAEK